MKDLPQCFVFVLNRFEYDYDKMIRNKISNYCELPNEIDMTPYYDGVEVDQDLHFYLSGMIIHQGSSEIGHYYSIIKDPELNKWLLLNDEEIYEIDEDYMKEQAFGNFENNGPPDSPSAYVIFYQRYNTNIKTEEKIKNLKDIKDQDVYDYISYENDKSKIRLNRIRK